MIPQQDVFKVTARRKQPATSEVPAGSPPPPVIVEKVERAFAPTIVMWLALTGLLLLLPKISFAFIHIGAALTLAALLAPVVALFVRHNVPRTLAIILVLGVVVGAVVCVLPLLYPLLVAEIAKLSIFVETSEPQKLAGKLSVLLLKVLPWLRTKGILLQLETMFAPLITTFVQSALAFEIALLANLASYAIITLLVFYTLRWGNETKRKIIAAVPNRHLERTALLLEKVIASAGRYLRLQAFIAVIAGILLALAFYLMPLPGIFIMGVYGALTLLTPYWGALLGAIPIAVAGINSTNSLHVVFGIILALATMQLLTNILLATSRRNKTARLQPWEALLALLLGGSLGGVWGILFGAPLAALCKIILRETFTVMRSFRG